MFLIWYCKTATLNEKIAAWQEIVGDVPSCPWDYAWDDIRERVAAYIELQEKMLGQFQAAGSCVYQYRLAAAEETDSGGVYRSYKKTIMSEEKANQKARLKIPMERIRKYFSQSYTADQIEDAVVKLCERDYRRRTERVR